MDRREFLGVLGVGAVAVVAVPPAQPSVVTAEPSLRIFDIDGVELGRLVLRDESLSGGRKRVTGCGSADGTGMIHRTAIFSGQDRQVCDVHLAWNQRWVVTGAILTVDMTVPADLVV